MDLEAEFHETTEGMRPDQLASTHVREARWALEELRVSLFAQGIRTAFPVSEKRIQRAIEQL